MLLYVLVKYAVETAWCAVGLRRRGGSPGSRILPALQHGLARLLIGRTMMFLVEGSQRGVSEWLTYVAVLLPLRWLAWSLIAELLETRRIRLRGILAGDRSSNTWRLGGTALSCVTDLPALFAGIWVGQFWP